MRATKIEGKERGTEKSAMLVPSSCKGKEVVQQTMERRKKSFSISG
jgi:hypothetical protein